MKNRLSNLSSEWLLLLCYTAVFIILVLLRNSQFWSQREASSALVQIVNSAGDRQSTFDTLYRSGINEEIAILKSLYSYHEDKTENFLNKIITQIQVNDSLIIESKKEITGSGERQLFNELELLNDKKKQSLDVLFQLMRKEKYGQAITNYESGLENLYLQIHKIKSDLRNKVVSHDRVLINQYGRKITHINDINIGISLSILVLLISLGIFLFRLIKVARKANSEVKESERKYRTLTEQTNEIIEECDASGKFIFANDFFKRTLEYNDEDLSLLTVSDILSEGSVNIDQEGSKDKVITNVQRIYKSKSGKPVYIEGTILLEYKNGKFDRSMGFFNDVTEKKELEESLVASELKFRNFFNLAPIPMWVIDPQTNKFMFVNKAATEHYKYSDQEFLNMTIFDIRRGKDFLKESEDVKRIKEETLNLTQDKTAKYNFNHLKKDGERIEVEIYTSPIVINDRKCILVISIDVTERNQFENRLTKAIIKTQEDERYEIGSELHDNVCQILAAAKMSLGMIRTSLAPSVIPTYNQSCDAILLATKEIRNLSHRLAPAFFDNTRLEEAFKSLLKTFNVENAYHISMYFDKGSKNILLDQEIKLNLYRILQEQLRNIITHSKCTDIEIKVFVYHNWLHMRIADNGVGFQVDDVKKGIGFANMKRRAELFSGKLHITASPGQGCEIMVVIPILETN
jgi:PAS domain S-box-containing protein